MHERVRISIDSLIYDNVIFVFWIHTNRRKQFCGISWGSASAACSNWWVNTYTFSFCCLLCIYNSDANKTTTFNKRCPNADDAECPRKSQRTQKNIEVCFVQVTLIPNLLCNMYKFSAGQTCFGDTSCYYSDDIVPTQSPTETQSEPPTTRAPSVYEDPSNRR